MSAVPPPSRRVLGELRADRVVSVDATGRAVTPVARAWNLLEAALDAHAAALAALDRIEATIVAAHGYPRVPLPGVTLDYAADAATIDRRVSNRATARRLKTALHRRQQLFAQARPRAASRRRRDARRSPPGTSPTRPPHYWSAPPPVGLISRSSSSC